ncbi:MAG TPA: S1C family serine protease [Bauldia sp.]|nr:S1C family serine protease [Bauldia sp.]
MPPDVDWQVTPAFQPNPKDYSYDLDAALAAVVSVKSVIPDDAFTAGILGTERSGSGVLIDRSGLVLTIGYLITEAETIWLGLSDGRTVPGHALGYDQATGFGLIQALARIDVPALALGRSGTIEIGTKVVLGGAGGRSRSMAAIVVGKQEFAGYWEYVLDEAIFTAPAHPFWGGSAMIGPNGDLCGIASLRLDQSREEGGGGDELNMIVPIDLLPPILNDLKTLGRPQTPPRPWLGIYAVEVEGKVVLAGLADSAPADRAGLATGDVVVAVAGKRVTTLASFFRSIWALGQAGVSVPLTIYHEGEVSEVVVVSADRNSFLKSPRLH